MGIPSWITNLTGYEYYAIYMEMQISKVILNNLKTEMYNIIFALQSNQLEESSRSCPPEPSSVGYTYI